MRAGEARTLMLVGGRGHNTDAMLAAVGVEPDSVEAAASTEAEVMAT
ncbi:hypothetical protein [Nocardioides sp. AN3]